MRGPGVPVCRGLWKTRGPGVSGPVENTGCPMKKDFKANFRAKTPYEVILFLQYAERYVRCDWPLPIIYQIEDRHVVDVTKKLFSFLVQHGSGLVRSRY